MNNTDNKKKKSKLIFDMKVTRALLKKNQGEPKYCPYCGTAFTDGCECHKNIVIDVKKLRGSEEASIAVFMNNESFKADLNEIMEEIKSKQENEPEQLTIDFGA